MEQAQIRRFVEKYFDAHHSHFVEKHPAYITVTLPKEVDKDIGNRPFYWTYVERCGIEPTSLTLTFIFDKENVPEEIKGEWLGFGTGRLLQIFQSAIKHGKFVRLYEEQKNSASLSGGNLVPLAPWLGINYRVEFICDQKRDWIISLGVNLVSGQVKSGFFEQVRTLPLTPKLPDYRFTIQPIFPLKSAMSIAERYVHDLLEKEDKQWAEKARDRMDHEIALVESFYQDAVAKETPDNQELLATEHNRRVQELKWQYEPRINVKLINAGMFHLESVLQ